MKVVALIPIKLINVRLPGKNTMNLSGRPLCDYLFKTIAGIDEIDEKYVYCSDPAITDYIPQELKFLQRDSCLDAPDVKGIEIYKSFANAVEADVYILTHVTSPFLRASSLVAAIKKLRNEGYDSAFAAQEIKEFSWFNGEPLNYGFEDVVLTQDLKPVFVETSGFYMFKRDILLVHGRRIGFNPYMHIVDGYEAVDIDTKDDFNFAQVVVKHLSDKEGA